ncbi:MAG: DNA-J related domain-containing protein [Pseudomonadota bacterium]
MFNPLKRPILEILEQRLKQDGGVIKEYDLHSTLGGDAFAEFIKDCSWDLGTFRKHFLVMNALYELHEELLSQNIFLHISALEIQLKKKLSQAPLTTSNGIFIDSGFSKLSSYYRNWDNFYQVNDKDVAQLLQQFWNTFLANEEKASSLANLELKVDANWSEIQQQYRRLCQKHHPDKGGDALRFIQIKQAYENLKRSSCFNQI